MLGTVCWLLGFSLALRNVAHVFIDKTLFQEICWSVKGSQALSYFLLPPLPSPPFFLSDVVLYSPGWP